MLNSIREIITAVPLFQIGSSDQFEHPSLIQCSLLSPGTIVRSFGHVMYVKYLMKRQSPTSFIATYKESLAGECHISFILYDTRLTGFIK